MNALALAYVAVGGAVGSVCRYALQVLSQRYILIDFPVGTLAVNVLGAFLMGAWVASVAVFLPAKARELNLLLGVGILGGFTTFSAFSVETFFLLERAMWMQAAVYIIGSVALSLLALLGGVWMVKFLFA